jgi:hypothetical protein
LKSIAISFSCLSVSSTLYTKYNTKISLLGQELSFQ